MKSSRNINFIMKCNEMLNQECMIGFLESETVKITYPNNHIFFRSNDLFNTNINNPLLLIAILNKQEYVFRTITQTTLSKQLSHQEFTKLVKEKGYILP